MNNATFKILLVDDEELDLKLMSRLLSCDRYTLHTSGNGKDTIELTQRLNPDLVLLDLHDVGKIGISDSILLKPGSLAVKKGVNSMTQLYRDSLIITKRPCTESDNPPNDFDAARGIIFACFAGTVIWAPILYLAFA